MPKDFENPVTMLDAAFDAVLLGIEEEDGDVVDQFHCIMGGFELLQRMLSTADGRATILDMLKTKAAVMRAEVLSSEFDPLDARGIITATIEDGAQALIAAIEGSERPESAYEQAVTRHSFDMAEYHERNFPT